MIIEIPISAWVISGPPWSRSGGPAEARFDKGESMEPIMQFFAYEHLPAHLQEVSKPFGELAKTIVEALPRNPERTVALRKLLESKDAAVRAKLFKE